MTIWVGITFLFLFSIVICLSYQVYCHDKTIDAMIEADSAIVDAIGRVEKHIKALEKVNEDREGEL